jgi:hypothetical protein
VLAVPQEGKGGAQARLDFAQGLAELRRDFGFGISVENRQFQRAALRLGHLVECSLKQAQASIYQGDVLRPRHPELRRRGEE